MNTLTVEYQDKNGYQIVRIDEKKYYFGNGVTTNAIGISANQFLRFHPYMEYVGDKMISPTGKIRQWIESKQ